MKQHAINVKRATFAQAIWNEKSDESPKVAKVSLQEQRGGTLTCVCVCAFSTIASGPKRQTTKRTNRKNNMRIDTTKSHGPWLGTKPTKRTAKQTFAYAIEAANVYCIVADRFHSRTRETPVGAE